MSIIIPANSAASGGYAVDNSLRFNSASSDYLTRTPSSTGNRRTATWSAWIKKSSISGEQAFLSFGGSMNVGYTNGDSLRFNDGTGNALYSNNLQRDTSAWYHFVIAIDTTQGTAANRVKMYINGVQVTSFAAAIYPDVNEDLNMNQSSVTNTVGSANTSIYFNGYMAEVCWIDGQALDPTSFGEFDEDSGIWKPISVSGLTYGTNGFYLDFEDSGALGDDVSGNGNDFTVNNLTATDQSTDTCTNNFCTLSPLADSTSILSDGNCVNNADGSQTTSKGSIAVSNGRWYTECKITTSSQYPMLGIWSVETAAFQNPTNTSYPGQVTPSYGGYGNGSIYANGSNTGSQGFTWGNGNIIGIYLDLESATKTIKWYKDGSSIATLNLATTTDAFVFGDYNSANSLTASWNFGNPVFAISSGNTDANGYGNFEFSPTIGGVDYFAICTKNLAEYG